MSFRIVYKNVVDPEIVHTHGRQRPFGYGWFHTGFRDFTSYDQAKKYIERHQRDFYPSGYRYEVIRTG